MISLQKIYNNVYITVDIITVDIGACIGNGSVGLRPHPGTSPRLRACYESLAMMAVLKPLLNMLDDKGLRHSFTHIEMPHLACLSKMETEGLGEMVDLRLFIDSNMFTFNMTQ